jgi:hypothetical protein
MEFAILVDLIVQTVEKQVALFAKSVIIFIKDIVNKHAPQLLYLQLVNVNFVKTFFQIVKHVIHHNVFLVFQEF